MQYGPWHVEEELGRGGMGVVFAGRHVDTGGRAAVKVLHHSHADALGGLWREVFALSRLEHPQIVRILGHGVQDDAPWIALEWVEGELLSELAGHSGQPQDTFQLSDLLDEPGPPEAGEGEALPVERALQLIAGLCHPLATLHGAGLVHRDLKPDNVVVRPDGVPVLLDLGLAVTSGGRDELRGSDGTTGTPATVAPEQVAGELSDARADLYALGCVAFQLLSGRSPFLGTAAQVLHGHLHVAPPRLRELRDEVPPEVEELVARLLAKDRRERPGHALEVEAVLRSLGVHPLPVDGLPTPLPHVYRPRLAGRSRDLDELCSALDGLGIGTDTARVVVGRSGQGKTRLLHELARGARARSVAVVSIDCRPDSVGAGDVLRLLARLGSLVQRRRSPQVWATWGPVLVQVAPSLRARGVPSSPEPELLEPAAARERLALALTEVILATASTAPLLVLVDDLQWATPTLRDVVRRLVARRGEASVALGIAWRAEEEDTFLRALGDDLPRVSPPTLAVAEVGDLVQDMLAAPPPPGLVEAVAERSGGSPLWVSELVAAAVQSGRLVRGAGSWEMVAPLPPARSLDAVVALRVGGLSASVRRLLSRCALQGRRVEASLLGVEADEVDEGLRQLVQRGLLVDDGRGVAFVHDAVREAIVRAVEPDERRSHHEALAEALSSSAGRIDHLAELAAHLAAAGRREEASAAYAAAARHEEEQLRDPLPLWERSVALVDVPTLETLDRHRVLVEQLADTDVERAAAQLVELQRAAERVGGPIARAVVREAEGHLAFVQGDRERFIAAAEEALAIREQEGVLDRQRPLCLAIAASQINYRRISDAKVTLARLLALPGGADDIEVWRMHVVVALAEERAEDALEALAEVERRAHTPSERALLLDVKLFMELDPAGTGPLLVEMTELADRLEARGLLNVSSSYQQHVAAQRYVRGEYELGIACAHRSIVVGQRLGAALRQCYGWYYVAMCTRLSGGSLDEAEHAARQVVVYAIQLGSPKDEADGYCELAHVALARGEDPHPWLQRARDVVADVDPDAHLEMVLARLEAAIDAHDRGESLVYGSRPEDLTERQRMRAARDGVLTAGS